MRITGGICKGRILAGLPKDTAIRPTSDRVREAVFSILGQHLTGLRVLDLFSGTGGLGLEALSRGAQRAVFIDHSRQSIELIHKNIRLCGYGPWSMVLKADLNHGIPRRAMMQEVPFHLIFLDPPYRWDRIPSLLKHHHTGKVLAPGGRVVAETAKTVTLPERLGPLNAMDTRTYGDTRITLYRNKERP